MCFTRMSASLVSVGALSNVTHRLDLPLGSFPPMALNSSQVQFPRGRNWPSHLLVPADDPEPRAVSSNVPPPCRFSLVDILRGVFPRVNWPVTQLARKRMPAISGDIPGCSSKRSRPPSGAVLPRVQGSGALPTSAPSSPAPTLGQAPCPRGLARGAPSGRARAGSRGPGSGQRRAAERSWRRIWVPNNGRSPQSSQSVGPLARVRAVATGWDGTLKRLPQSPQA